MSIIALQRSIAEAGRIRIGHQVPTGGGRTRPAKLETFRLTSADRRRIEDAAALFGGTVRAWAAPAGPQWEVITEATEINVIVPPQAMAFSQFYEMWSGGGCQRRCDGQTEALSEGDCLCDPETRVELAKTGQACDIHTRLSLLIRDLPGLSLWRLDTQGYYAARELAGAVDIMTMAAGRGILLPARLLLEQRTVKRPGKDGKPQTLRFPVPRLDPGITPGELVALPSAMPMAALGDGTLADERPKLIPVPRDTSPVPSIAEQSAAPAARTPRRNAATEIPASGRRRNTAHAKQPGDDGYWRSRAFADGADRDIDADRMRAIAAELVGEDAVSFSMADLDETAWERIHRVVVAFAPKNAPGADDDPAQLPTSTPDAAVAGGSQGATQGDAGELPAGLTRDQLVEGLREIGVTTGVAAQRSQAMWPDRGATPLSDTQRLELLETLRSEATTAAAL